jgi:hypothetical protein
MVTIMRCRAVCGDKSGVFSDFGFIKNMKVSRALDNVFRYIWGVK